MKERVEQLLQKVLGVETSLKVSSQKVKGKIRMEGRLRILRATFETVCYSKHKEKVTENLIFGNLD